MSNTEVKTKVDRSDKIIFGTAKSPFFKELKARIKAYQEQTGIPADGGMKLFFKALFLLASYILSFIAIFLLPLPGWVAIALCIYMGLAAAAIGFNVMHDGSHGSFSTKPWVNTIAAYSINLLGGSAVLWKSKHNLIHHTFTNLEGLDQDIALDPILRSCESQKKLGIHKYQHMYCFVLYALSSVLWIFVLDFIKYFSGKVGNIKIASFTFSEHFVFWLTKIFYVVAYLLLPAFYFGWTYTLIGFTIYHVVLGTTLSVVFQLAHVVENTEFPEEHFNSNRIEDEWAIHQLKTTTNFSVANPLITWYTGGLNFQVEHHLFPKISHIHYPALNKITKQLCLEMNIPYNEYPSFFSALQSHIAHLKKTGVAN